MSEYNKKMAYWKI